MRLVGNQINGWLAGLLDGDGHIKLELSNKRNPRWLYMVYVSTEEGLAEQYLRVLEHFNISYRITYVDTRPDRPTEKPLYRIVSGKSEEVASLFTRIRFFHANKQKTLVEGAHWLGIDPILVFNDIDIEYWKGYLGGIIDSEGSVSILPNKNGDGLERCYISFINTDPGIIGTARFIMDMLEIKYSEWVNPEKGNRKASCRFMIKGSDSLKKVWELIPLASPSKRFKLEIIYNWVTRPDKRRNWEELAPIIYQWLNEEKLTIDEVIAKLDMPVGKNRAPEIYRALRKYGYPVPDMRSSTGIQLKSSQDWTGDSVVIKEPKERKRKDYYPPIIVEEVAKWYFEDKLTFKEIAAKLNRSTGSIRLITDTLRKAGYEIDPYRDIRKGGKGYQKNQTIEQQTNPI